MKKKDKKNPTTIKQIFLPESELDYHELGELTLYDIEKILNEFIEDSYLSKITYVLVITGKGLVVRPLVSKLLKINKFIESFNFAGYHNGQEGAFEIRLQKNILH